RVRDRLRVGSQFAPPGSVCGTRIRWPVVGPRRAGDLRMRSGAMRKRLTAALHDASDDLLRYFLRRLDREDAADALADVMATAWARVDGMPDDCEQARMWLFGIARNVLLHAHRGNVRRSQLADRIRATLSLRA